MDVSLTPARSVTEQRRRSPPPGWQELRIRMDDGWMVRTGGAGPAAPPRGTILLVNGRGDFIEKTWESMRDFAERGFATVSFDWRGQGKSGRLGDGAEPCHADGFDRLLADAVALLDGPWAQLPQPLFIAGHSMGGHMTARLLGLRQQRFAKAALLAPMLGIQSGPLPPAMIRRLVRLMIGRGRARRYAFGQGGYGPRMQSPLRQGRLTGSTERFADEAWFMATLPELRLGGVTFGWLQSAFDSIDKLLGPGVPEAITLPILMLLPEHESLVDPEASRRFAARLVNAEVVDVAGARHELLRESDALRAAVLERLDRFFTLHP